MIAEPTPTVEGLVVRSPVTGRLVALSEVPDEVFAQEMVGPGVAVEPVHVGGGRSEVLSPVSGTVGSLFPHAAAIEVGDGRTVLVHLGIDTVALAGEGFTVLVAVGDWVRAGAPLIVWDPEAVARAGMATVCPVIALQAEPGSVTVLPTTGGRVQAGAPIFVWGTDPRLMISDHGLVDPALSCAAASPQHGQDCSEES